MGIVLETPRLLLRKPKRSDVDDVHEGVNDKKTTEQLLVVPYPYTKKDAQDFVNRCIASWRKKEMDKYSFYIELKSENKVIGVIDLRVNSQSKIANTGSWLNKKYRRNGYMTEAKIAVNNFAFNDLGMRRLHTEVFAQNIPSQKTQEKMGYVKEGYLRKHAIAISTGKIHDEIKYGMLKSEWQKRLPQLKKEMKEKYW